MSPAPAARPLSIPRLRASARRLSGLVVLPLLLSACRPPPVPPPPALTPPVVLTVPFDSAWLAVRRRLTPLGGTLRESLVDDTWTADVELGSLEAELADTASVCGASGDARADSGSVTVTLRDDGTGRVLQSSAFWFSDEGHWCQSTRALEHAIEAGTFAELRPPTPAEWAAAFAPVVVLHQKERFYPMDAAVYAARVGLWRLSSAKLRPQYWDAGARTWLVAKGDGPASTGKPWWKGMPLESLGRRPRSRLVPPDGETWAWLAADSATLAGVAPSELRGAVPLYYSYEQVGRCELLSYWLFFANSYFHDFGKLAFSHEGDWEGMSVVTREGRVQALIYEAHGKTSFVTGDRLHKFAGPRPTMYVARDRHGSYGAPGLHSVARLVDRIWTGLRDDTSSPGARWETDALLVDLDDFPLGRFLGGWGRWRPLQVGDKEYYGVWADDLIGPEGPHPDKRDRGRDLVEAGKEGVRCL